MCSPQCHSPTFGTTLDCQGPDYSPSPYAVEETTPPAPLRQALGTFGGYELLKMIARGGMGIIYHARSLRTGKEVALKALPGAGFWTIDARKRFEIESRTMASLVHPGILPVYEQGEAEGTPFFTMQLATGGSLEQRKAQYKGQWQSIAELVASIADVVHFAHEQGVLHRDLKPANILFDEAGNAFVCDFGIAKLADNEAHLTRTFTQLGTPHYMSPEMVTQNGLALTAASDVWSLGVILYELLAGVRPFKGSSPAQIMRQVEESPPPPLTHVPRDLALIVFKALSKDPSKRYASAKALSKDLMHWLHAEPITARAPRLANRVRAWLPGYPSFALLGALLVLSLYAQWTLTDESLRSMHPVSYKVMGNGIRRSHPPVKMTQSRLDNADTANAPKLTAAKLTDDDIVRGSRSRVRVSLQPTNAVIAQRDIHEHSALNTIFPR